MSAPSAGSYDLVLVGTGFASTFFLHSYLQAASKRARVLVLERGQRYSLKWQLENREHLGRLREGTFINTNPDKPWIHSPIFGGGSNCWWGCTPRFLPNDFRLRSAYGVGLDWPLGYDDLETFYQEAEELMAVSGPADAGPFPRRRPYPQPPHRLSDPDKVLKRAYPGQFFEMPTARARTPTRNRPPCCATGTCELCPIDAKFTIANELGSLYADPRVTLLLGATVEEVLHAGSQASGVRFQHEGGTREARGDLVGLGANALFNPHLLLRSGLDHPLLGTRLNEQMSLSVVVHLRGLDSFQGSTSLTGHGYMLYDGPHRARHAACLMETSNLPVLRLERGRWRQRLEIKFIFEDLPDPANRVELARRRPGLPRVRWQGHSEYARRGAEALLASLPRLLAPLPVEEVAHHEYNETESHILGTALMGHSPEDSIVDRNLVHHRLRNLLVLGGSAFPTSSPANPTLTIAALSLWAASKLKLGP
jgi:choline dehydrogenase-like flavoprotein